MPRPLLGSSRHAPLTLFDCVTCAIYSRSLYATSQRHDLGQWCTVGGVSLWLARQHAGRKKSTRAAKKKSTRAAALARKKESLGNRASNAYKSFRIMLLTGSWSHLVSRYAGPDLHSRTGGFFFCFFNLGASSSSPTTSIGMLPIEELQSDSDDGCDSQRHYTLF